MSLKERLGRLFRLQSVRDDRVLEGELAPWKTPTRKIRKIRPDGVCRPPGQPRTGDYEYDHILRHIAPEEDGDPPDGASPRG
ncbi:MAG: hypothetical protein FJ098_06935 [Deltaproteobacteria bacterium]|nr:hypothetical protein [Deltaproteobacteria bacterium]